MKCPIPRVPVGVMTRECSCRQSLVVCWYCWQTLAADPLVMLMRMCNLKPAGSCTFSFSSSVVAATPLSRASSIAVDAAPVCSSSSGYLLLLSSV